MSDSESGEQLHEEFTLIAAHIQRLADAFMHTVLLPSAADSPAQVDREDTTYDHADGWGRPLFEYSHRLAPLSAQAFDHMQATASLVLADRVVQAPMTVMRTAIEALSMIFWLYEPGISQEEKVRRHINLRLVRAAEGLNEYLAVGGESSGAPKPSEPIASSTAYRQASTSSRRTGPDPTTTSEPTTGSRATSAI